VYIDETLFIGDLLVVAKQFHWSLMRYTVQSVEFDFFVISFFVSKDSNLFIFFDLKEFVLKIYVNSLLVSLFLEHLSIFWNSENDWDTCKEVNIGIDIFLGPVVMREMHDLLGCSRTLDRQGGLLKNCFSTLELVHNISPFLSITMVVNGTNRAIDIFQGISHTFYSFIMVLDTRGYNKLIIAIPHIVIGSQLILISVNFGHLIHSPLNSPWYHLKIC